MADRDTLRRAASGVDVVIHTASAIVERYCRDHPEEAARTIVDGTRNVTEAAAEAGALLVHLSTLSVYSSYRERPMPLREDSALLPDTTYGTLKAEAEREAARIPSVILRISNAYGVGGAVAPHAHMVTRLFVSRAIRAEPLMVLGEGGRKKFQRYSAAQLCIFGEIDCAHAAFAQQRNNLVMGHCLTCFEFVVISQHLRRRLISRRVNKVILFFVRLEK